MDAAQTVQEPIAILLVNFEVARRVKRDAVVLRAFGMYAQRNLLRHRATGHEDGRFFAEQCRYALLECRNRVARPVDVGTLVARRTIGNLAQERRDRSRRIARNEVRRARSDRDGIERFGSNG